MSSKIKILLALFAIFYFAYQIFALPLNPIPWIDEVFFASMSKNMMDFGTLHPEVTRETFSGEEVFIYGPLHFYLESFSLRIFGFGIFQYRWITFAFGIITILATANLLRLYHNSIKAACILIVVFALDPFMNLSMHEGRMDLVSIALMLISLNFLIRGLREQGNQLFFFAGLFAVLSILTTPRVGIIFIPIVLIFLFMLEGKPLKSSLIKISLWAAPIILLYGWWMFYAFGGLSEMFKYYKDIEDTKGDYLGGKFYIPRSQTFLIFLTILSVIYGVYKKGKSYFNELVVISLLSIILFYIVIVDWGPYSAFILPFYYLLFFNSLNDLDFNFKKIAVYPVLLLFFINLGYFSLKSIQVLSERENRDPSVADKFIIDHIPKGSKVIGDPQYYYSVIKAGSEYRIYDDFLTPEDRERLLREVFDYDYLIITDRSKGKEMPLIKLLLSKAEFKKVADLHLQQPELSKMVEATGIVSYAERSGYNATIYVRIKDQKSPVAFGNSK